MNVSLVGGSPISPFMTRARRRVVKSWFYFFILGGGKV